MARLSHLFLLALVFCSSLLSGSWAAADDTDSPAPKETTPPTQRRVKISQQDYPYGKPKEATGVKFSEYQSLAVPPYILVVVLILFLGAAAYVIYKIFDTQQEKERKKAEKAKAKEDKKELKAQKGSKKGSRKVE